VSVVGKDGEILGVVADGIQRLLQAARKAEVSLYPDQEGEVISLREADFLEEAAEDVFLHKEMCSPEGGGGVSMG